jgi:hypothetical protein
MGANRTFSFLIPFPGKAISAISPEREIIVPIPNCICSTLHQLEKSPTAFDRKILGFFNILGSEAPFIEKENDWPGEVAKLLKFMLP